MKTCLKCKETKELSEFHKDRQKSDGLRKYCKICHTANNKKWESNNRDKVKEQSRRYYRKNAKRIIENGNKYNKNYPERAKALWTVHYAVKSGKIDKQPCFICGKEAEAHHPCYDLPLDVSWLCKSHHKQLHNEFLAYPPCRL